MSESAAQRLRHHASAESPVIFPSEEKVPESTQHLKLRTLLYLVLDHHGPIGRRNRPMTLPAKTHQADNRGPRAALPTC